MKAMYDKHKANILNSGKVKAFPLRAEQDEGVHDQHAYASQL